MKHWLYGAAIAATAALMITGCGDTSGSNPAGPGGINPNSGPSASNIAANYSPTVLRGIAGLNEQTNGMTPGFLSQLNIAALFARTSAISISDVPPTEPSGYNNGWYERRDTIQSTGAIQLERERWTPNPFRGGGTPNSFDYDMTMTSTQPAGGFTATTTTFMNYSSSLASNHTNGLWDYGVTVSMNTPLIPSTTWHSPYDWDNVNVSRSGSSYTSPEGNFHGIGSAYLPQSGSTAPALYNYEGRWVIPTNVANGDSIGWLKVGGELFAGYRYVSFNSTLGLYNGQYRMLVGSDQSWHNFAMTGHSR